MAFLLGCGTGCFLLKKHHFLSRNASLVSSVHLLSHLKGFKGMALGSVVDLDGLLHVGVPRPLVRLQE